MQSIINRKAFHNYDILESLEVGLVLHGSEVKSIKGGQISLNESYIKIINGQMYLWNANIPRYVNSALINYDPIRNRKVLIHKSQIIKWSSKMKQGNLTIIPLKVYSNDGKIKMEIGLCRGKKVYEKKLQQKERDLKIELHREKRKFMV